MIVDGDNITILLNLSLTENILKKKYYYIRQENTAVIFTTSLAARLQVDEISENYN